MYALIFSLLLFFLLLFVTSPRNKMTFETMINDTNSNNSNNSINSTSTNSTNSNSNNSTAVYQPYSGNDPMILAQKNAANIQFLKEKMADLQKLESSFNSLDTKVDTNTTNIKKMAQYATNRITQTTGISPTGGIPSSLSELSTIKPEELDTTTN